MKNAVKQNGAKLIVMDPRRQSLSRIAHKHLAFKPGTDVSMLNAMLHVIITEKLYDEQYVAAYTENFEALRENIKDFTPERMAPVCGVDADTLTEWRDSTREPRLDHLLGHGHKPARAWDRQFRCLIALALITGQIGRKGTGLHPCAARTTCRAPRMPASFPWYSRLSVGGESLPSGSCSRSSGVRSSIRSGVDRR
jgi:formate dehydrogenase major subunit